MAQMQIDFFSNSLRRTVNIKVIIPTDKHLFPGRAVPEKKPYKTLYLLHGVFGNNTDWISGTRVQLWAEERNLVVVMPDGENKFYTDNNISGDRFSTFLGEELIQFTRDTLPLSAKREDTFIGGLSMGGYGAIVNGLKYHNVFGRICAFSSGLILEKYRNADNTSPNLIDRKSFYEASFGPYEAVPGSDKDYYYLAKITADLKEKPMIYMACGTQDPLTPDNRKFHDYLQKAGYDVTYEEWTGNHDWLFWDQCIEKVMGWLPVGPAIRGIGSGNTTCQKEKEDKK